MGSISSPKRFKVSSSLQDVIDVEFTVIDEEEKETKLIEHKELEEDK